MSETPAAVVSLTDETVAVENTTNHAPIPQQAALQETSILVDSFVPQRLRAVNLSPITRPIFTIPAPFLEAHIRHIYKITVPRCPCKCAKPHSAFAKDFSHPPEFHFSLYPPPPMEAPPHVDNVSNLLDYVQTFTKLLEWERREILMLYERYSRYQHQLQNTTGFSHVGWTIPGIADANPAIEPGDVCLIRPLQSLVFPVDPPNPNWNPKHYHPKNWPKPRIHTVEIVAQVANVQRSKHGLNDSVTTTWVDEQELQFLHIVYPSHQYNLRFVPSPKHYSRCRTALDWCASLPPDVAMNLLFPNTSPILPTVVHTKSQPSNLNPVQNNFVDMVLKRSLHPADQIRPPMILTGPAGTGKTKALLQAISEVLKLPKTRILVCAPSHTAANVITQRLAQQDLDKTQLFRLLDYDRPVATIPAGILRFCKQTSASGSFTLPEKLLSFRVIVCTCSDANLLFQAGITNAQLRDRRQCFANWVQDSLKDTNMSTTLDGVDDPHFTHLFIDEASQATEPETLIPLSVVVDPDSCGPAEIALVGDPRQLSPQVYSSRAHKCGLGRAWMERMLHRPCRALGGGHDHMLGPSLNTVAEWVQDSFQIQLSTFLTMNYRGNPAFLMMPSGLFYFDKLQSHKGIDDVEDSGWQKGLRETVESMSEQVVVDTTIPLPPMLRHSKKRTWPIHFRGVTGKDTSVTIQTFRSINSWSNRQEANVVVELVVAMTQEGVSTQVIGVMATFRGQVVLIRQMLRDRNLSGVNVGTIEDYQSVEREIVVLSLTRSNKKFVPNDVLDRVGVFRQPKRTNVAMTRAENVFIVVGNPSIMVEDPIWRQWLWFCLRNGLWYGEGKGVVEKYFKHHRDCRIARHFPSSNGGDFLFPTSHEEKKNEDDDDIIVLSTLEALCSND